MTQKRATQGQPQVKELQAFLQIGKLTKDIGSENVVSHPQVFSVSQVHACVFSDCQRMRGGCLLKIALNHRCGDKGE
jgi:hypothetical protein